MEITEIASAHLNETRWSQVPDAQQHRSGTGVSVKNVLLLLQEDVTSGAAAQHQCGTERTNIVMTLLAFYVPESDISLD